MKILYLDCFSGISGDMFLAALLDAAALQPKRLEEQLSALGLGRVSISARKVKRGAISATHLSFKLARARAALKPRGFQDICTWIKKSRLASKEKQRAGAIFQSLAEAESKIHDIPIEEVHFHELGALDSILDIVGVALVIEQLQIERAFVSKINLGSGFVETEHGRLPVPAPATLELLKGLPTYSSGIEAELTTPTGAALLRHLSPEYGLPPARWDAIGYGAGSRDLKEQPNVLRLLIGEALSSQKHPAMATEEAVVIETDLDDMNPQLLPYVQERLLAQGAQDVSWHSLQMKKNRPGVRLYVLGPPERVDALCETIFQETTTLGLRLHRVEKRRLSRKLITAETPHGPVRVKVALSSDRIVNVAPEYDDCLKLARKTGKPLKEILQGAIEMARRQLK